VPCLPGRDSIKGVAPASGICAAGFEPVRAAFLAPFLSGREVGGAVCVLRNGEPWVDLWAGHRESARTRRWERETLCMPYSVSKAMVAFCAILLADRGRLDLDAPVTETWPEFAAAGKRAVTARMVLSHQAGVVALDEPLPAEAMLDWDRITGALAAARPRWEPGSAFGESARFYGHLVGELVRRIDGRSLGRFFREEVAVPCGIDFHFGLGDAELARCAEMVGFTPGEEQQLAASFTPLGREATENPPGMLDPAVINAEAFRRAEIPAINGHGTARGVARFYALLAAGGELGGHRLVSAAAVARMVELQRAERDLVFDFDARWALGVHSQADGSFGMGGLGGHLGMANPGHGIAIGYLKNRLGLDDPAEDVLVAVAKCVAAGA
jgi:CubicO group peptidase (beta-lactamase class C family)